MCLSCRESCAAYKRNPQNHIASHNCKIGKCAAKLASACKKCIRTCHNIMSVALDQTDKGTPDLKKTTFETCYHTFGCANDCDASLKKVKGKRWQEPFNRWFLSFPKVSSKDRESMHNLTKAFCSRKKRKTYFISSMI